MIKMIGFFIVLLSSSKIGFDISKKYSDRAKELKSLITVFEIIKNEINFSNSVISDALKKASGVKNKNISDLIYYLAQKSKENDDIGKSFDNYLKINADNLSLKKCDIDVLEKIFNIIGSGDIKEEISQISNTVKNLEILLELSIQDEKKYSKLFKTTGILAGLLIAVIFI